METILHTRDIRDSVMQNRKRECAKRAKKIGCYKLCNGTHKDDTEIVCKSNNYLVKGFYYLLEQ